MPEYGLKRPQTSQDPLSSDLIPTVEPVNRSQENTSPQRDGLSFSQAIENDVKGSMQAVGQVCRIVMVGVFLCGLGGAAAFLSVALF